MFLIGVIKHIVEKKFKACFIFYATVYGRVVGRVRNKTSLLFLRSRFGGGNKNFIQKKGEILFYIILRVLIQVMA